MNAAYTGEDREIRGSDNAGVLPHLGEQPLTRARCGQRAESDLGFLSC